MRKKRAKFEWKRYRVRILTVAAVLLAVCLAASTIWMNFRLVELGNRMSYLQDTTSVIQTDVGSLQTELEKTLRKENSFLAEYSIETTEVDIAAGTYQVDISAIPKEYTDNTQLTIYFGTKEYALRKDGFNYTGRVTLPLEEAYDANVTVLITNGKKKNTEILRDYVGYPTQLHEILDGRMSDTPGYENGRCVFSGEVAYTLQGQSIMGAEAFESLCLVAVSGEEEFYREQLITEEAIEENPNVYVGPVAISEAPQEQGAVAMEERTDTTEEDAAADMTKTEDSGKKPGDAREDDAEEGETKEPETAAGIVTGLFGEYKLTLREEIPAESEVRIFLQAVSTEGYVFEQTLFSGKTVDGQKNRGQGDDAQTVLGEEGFTDVTQEENLDYRVSDGQGASWVSQ